MSPLHTEPSIDSPPARCLPSPPSTPRCGYLRFRVCGPDVCGRDIVPNDVIRATGRMPAESRRGAVVKHWPDSGFLPTHPSRFRAGWQLTPLATRLVRGHFEDWIIPSVEHRLIEDLGEPGYYLLRPIPAEISQVGPATFEASFAAANIAMVGTDTDDAFQGLVAQLLDTFDGLVDAESRLGRSAAEDLRVLRTYLVMEEPVHTESSP